MFEHNFVENRIAGKIDFKHTTTSPKNSYQKKKIRRHRTFGRVRIRKIDKFILQFSAIWAETWNTDASND